MGDRNLEKFRNDWDDVVSSLADSVSNRNLASILLEQMQKSQKLKPKVDKWMSYPKGHAKKTYSRLLDMMDRQLLLERQRANRADINEWRKA